MDKSYKITSYNEDTSTITVMLKVGDKELQQDIAVSPDDTPETIHALCIGHVGKLADDLANVPVVPNVVVEITIDKVVPVTDQEIVDNPLPVPVDTPVETASPAVVAPTVPEVPVPTVDTPQEVPVVSDPVNTDLPSVAATEPDPTLPTPGDVIAPDVPTDAPVSEPTQIPVVDGNADTAVVPDAQVANDVPTASDTLVEQPPVVPGV